MSFTSPAEVVKYIEEEGIEFVDVRFTDVPGTEQHFTIPASAFDEDAAAEGLAFDGSSIRGFTTIDESDMTLLPDLGTAKIDPFRKAKTLNIKFFVHDPFTLEPFSRDPRNIARKAEEYLQSTGIADTCFFGAEAEFYIFDKVRYSTEMNAGFYEVDSVEGWWTRGKENNPDGTPNLGYKTRMKGGYFPVPPYDKTVDIRDAMVHNLVASGFDIERFHREVGNGGQQEINYKFNTLLHAADDIQSFKYIIKSTAWRNNKSVTFMPKPLYKMPGNGMHVHQFLEKDGKAIFPGDVLFSLSQEGLSYIAGMLSHSLTGSLLAFACPSTNSYRRLVHGYEAPVSATFAKGSRAAAVRIPGYVKKEETRVEYRTGDASCNLYFFLAAMVLAGADGIIRKMDPVALGYQSQDAKEELTFPLNLNAVLDGVEKDKEYLAPAFPEKLIELWTKAKRAEAEYIYNAPTPQEYELYF